MTGLGTDDDRIRDQLASARAEAEALIRTGRLGTVDELRDRYPAVWESADAALELIYTEYVLRRANGETPDRADWLRRYPHWSDRLDRLFGLYDLMAGDTHRPAATVGPDRPAAKPPAAAEHPDGYDILGEVGRGGMAVVYRARHRQLNRVVALKVLRWADWDAADDARRVRREAELVARLQHPNVVQVYEVGEWDGDPFLALEYVPGGTLADALVRVQMQGQTGVSTAEAAALVGRLAGAVQAAHDQGVVHRDLKPANVLLADDPTGPFARPKVADFGLAVTTDRGSAVSQTAALAGTPCYMAPEQADARRAAVGPRTDVYALGGLLYELLTGRPPFRGATVLETLDLVRHAEPVPPRLLRPNLPRDLETVCLKCLAKEPARRYQSAAALADDLARFRDGRPILARPVGRLEKGWKWCRRRPWLAGLAAALVLAVTLGVAGVTREYLRAEEERAKAVERLKQIELINGTVFDLFAELDLEQVRADDQPVEAALARKLIEAGQKLDADAIADPLVLANLRNRLGKTLLTLGEPAAAVDLLAAALEVRTAELGPDHEDTLTAAGDLGSAHLAAGRVDDALRLFDQTMSRSAAALGADHRITLATANNLAMGYRDARRFEQAIPLLEPALAAQRARFGVEDPDTLVTMNNLALCYHHTGRDDDALALYREALTTKREKHGRDNPATLHTLNNLASTYQQLGQMDKALPLFEEARDLKKAKLGFDHRGTLLSMANLALAYQLAGQLDQALPLYEETVRLRKARLGIDHPDTLLTMANLASCYQSAGDLDRAIARFEEVLALETGKYGPDGYDTLITMNNLALCHRAAGRPDQALPLHLKVVELQKAKTGLDHPDTHWYMNVLAAGYDALGRFDESAAVHREKLASVLKTFSKESAEYATAAAAFGKSLLVQKKWAEAEPLLREALAIREKRQPDHWVTFNTRSMLGGALLGQKKYADAAPPLVQGYEGMKAREKAIPQAGGSEALIPEALDRLVALYSATGKPDEVKKYQGLRAAYPRPKEKK
jgi:tetratricopeptide (TPR) repeat protein/tRNA A-37 threonylcarbamoyl transferase component Bud32